MNSFKIPLLALSTILLTVGCNQTNKKTNHPSSKDVNKNKQTSITKPVLNTTKTKPSDITKVSEANNQFAYDFYKLQAQKQDASTKNLFFSPYSLSTALAMTFEGARGETAEQMAKVLHFPEKQILAQGNAGIFNKINAKQTDYQLNTANALWIEKSFQLKPSYQSRVVSFYGGKASLLDFVNESEQSTKTINDFIEQQTNYKIKNLVTEDAVKSASLILTNAVYFKGNWAEPFEKDLTQNGQFLQGNGGQTTTAFMRKFKESMPYYEDNNIQMLKLNYKGGKLSMLVVLPKSDATTSQYKVINLEELNTARKNLQYEQVNLRLPKFKLETSYTLKKDLTDMGMGMAFSDKADFSEMSTVPVSISEVVHKAFVEVNELGTEAAAATAVVMVATSAPPEESQPKEFNANHPFTVMIVHEETDNILFIGKVNKFN